MVWQVISITSMVFDAGCVVQLYSSTDNNFFFGVIRSALRRETLFISNWPIGQFELIITVIIVFVLIAESLRAESDLLSVNCYGYGKGGSAYNFRDIDGNCVTDLRDFAILAAAWLDDAASTGPVIKQ